MNFFRKPSVVGVIVVYIILSTIAGLFLLVGTTSQLYDDAKHGEQIMLFFNALDHNRHLLENGVSFLSEPNFILPMFPLFHAVNALVAWTMHFDASVIAMRCVATIINIWTLFVFYLALRMTLSKEGAIIRTFSLFSLPFFFIYMSSLYTEIFSLLFVLLTYISIQKKNAASGLWAILSWVTRQTGIASIMTLMMIEYDAKYTRFSFSTIKKFILSNWTLFLSFVSFFIFVYINRGIALNISVSHHLAFTMLGNVFMLFAFTALLLLPFHLRTLRSLPKTSTKDIHVASYVSVFLFILFIFVDFSHPFNSVAPEWYLHNAIIEYISQSSTARVAMSFVAAIGVFFLTIQSLAERKIAILALVTVLTLIPVAHIAPRYVLPFFALYLLFKKSESIRVEATEALYLHGIALMTFFLVVIYHIEL